MRRLPLLLVVLVLSGGLPAVAQEASAQRTCVLHADGTFRQTTDPLSPPCVTGFDGDNGGDTAPGVTRDEIRIVLYADEGPPDGMNLTAPYEPSQEPVCTIAFQCTDIVRTLKAHLRYFTERFETYGRRVNVVVHRSTCSGVCTEAQRRGDALTVLRDHDPFAVVFFGDNANGFWDEMAEAGRPVFGVNFSAPSSLYEENAPLVWSLMPDVETEVASSASFICRKLAGQPARFGRGGGERRFGLIFEIDADGDLRPQDSAPLLREELLSQCGLNFVAEAGYHTDDLSATTTVLDALLQMRLGDVTTIVCYCLPGNEVAELQSLSTGIGYFPEWYWDSQSAMDRDIWQDIYFDDRQANFGSTYFWRQPAFKDQFHYRAFQAEEPGGTPNARFSWRSYHMFLSLFTALQVAGPELTSDTVAQGLSPFEVRRPDDPFVPSGGYGDGGPSPQTFIDTFMGWWRDPTGTPPGESLPRGCMRVADGGRRASPGEWPPGDADLFDPSDPCTAGPYKLGEI